MRLGTCLLRSAYVAVVLFMLAALYRQRETIIDVLHTVDPFMVAVASVVLCLYRVVNASVWGAVLNGLGASVSFRAATRVWLTTEALRWLPGGIWGFCSRVKESQRLGMTKSLAGLSLSVELILTIMAWGLAMTLGLLLSGLLSQVITAIPFWLLSLSAVAGVALLACVWRFRQSLLNLPMVRRLSVVNECQICWHSLGLALLAYTALCVVNGLAFYLLLGAFPQGSLSVSLFAAIGINAAGWLAGFALAWSAGLVVPGAPGGLGVFEAVLLLRLGFAIPEAPLLAIAISYRLVVTIADLLAALTARLDGHSLLRNSATAP